MALNIRQTNRTASTSTTTATTSTSTSTSFDKFQTNLTSFRLQRAAGGLELDHTTVMMGVQPSHTSNHTTPNNMSTDYSPLEESLLQLLHQKRLLIHPLQSHANSKSNSSKRKWYSALTSINNLDDDTIGLAHWILAIAPHARPYRGDAYRASGVMLYEENEPHKMNDGFVIDFSTTTQPQTQQQQHHLRYLFHIHEDTFVTMVEFANKVQTVLQEYQHVERRRRAFLRQGGFIGFAMVVLVVAWISSHSGRQHRPLITVYPSPVNTINGTVYVVHDTEI